MKINGLRMSRGSEWIMTDNIMNERLIATVKR